MVATKLLRDPPKCTAPKPITQDFTKLRKSTFTFATSVSHWCTFKYSYQPDSSKVRCQSFNRWSKLMVKTRQSTYSDNQWFRLVFFQLHSFEPGHLYSILKAGCILLYPLNLQGSLLIIIVGRENIEHGNFGSNDIHGYFSVFIFAFLSCLLASSLLMGRNMNRLFFCVFYDFSISFSFVF